MKPCLCGYPTPVAPNGEILCLVCAGSLAPAPSFWYAQDRERAKRGISEAALAYVEQLEEVARAALAIWKRTTFLGEPAVIANLYDALEKVDFMEEEE